MVTLALSHFEKGFPAALRGKRLGAVLHPASVCADLRYTLDLLKEYDGKLFKLSALFGPQHNHSQKIAVRPDLTEPRLKPQQNRSFSEITTQLYKKA